MKWTGQHQVAAVRFPSDTGFACPYFEPVPIFRIALLKEFQAFGVGEVGKPASVTLVGMIIGKGGLSRSDYP